MEAFGVKIKKLFFEYRRDFIVIAVLLVSYVLTASYIGNFFGCLYMDSGRELYIPEMVLQGKVMYKEVFMLYCPLAYYINAFLYLLFGVSLNNLIMFSYINGFIVLTGFYLICRMFLKEFFSFAFVFLIMSYYVLGGFSSLLSYIFPYSYSFVYAVTFFVFSNLLFLYYMKTTNKTLLFGSAFLAGCVYACKFEFVLYLIPFFFVMLLNREKFKTFIISVLLISLPGLLCLLALLLQGAVLSDIKEWFCLIFRIMHTPEYIAFNEGRVALPWNFYTLGVMIKMFFAFVFYIAFNAAYISLLFKNKYYKLFALISFLFYLIANYYIVVRLWDYTENIFNWHILVLAVVLLFKTFKYKDLREKMLIFVAVCGILSMSRINFMPLEKCNYTVFFLTSLIPLWVWFSDFKSKKIKNEKYKFYVAIALIIFSLFHNLRRDYLVNFSISELKFPGAYLLSEKRYVSAVTKSVEWLKKNTSEQDTVLVLPEGIVVNFFSGNPSVLKYFQLSPNHITGFGEKKIVDDLSKNKPDYILLTDTAFPAFDLGPFCKSYGLLLCEFTYKNYVLKDEITTYNDDGASFTTSVYKLGKE